MRSNLQVPNEARGSSDFDEVTGVTIGTTRGLHFAAIGALPTNYDDIVLTYTGKNLTGVVYKLAAVTLVTLTLTYTGNQLDRVQVA